MEKTNHVMIVGEGAHRFAVDEGFEDMSLLTEHSRKTLAGVEGGVLGELAAWN